MNPSLQWTWDVFSDSEIWFSSCQRWVRYPLRTHWRTSFELHFSMSQTFGEFYWTFFHNLPNLQHSFQALNYTRFEICSEYEYICLSVSGHCCSKRLSTSLAVKRWEIWFHTAPYYIFCSIVPRLNSNHHIRYAHTLMQRDGNLLVIDPQGLRF